MFSTYEKDLKKVESSNIEKLREKDGELESLKEEKLDNAKIIGELENKVEELKEVTRNNVEKLREKEKEFGLLKKENANLIKEMGLLEKIVETSKNVKASLTPNVLVGNLF